MTTSVATPKSSARHAEGSSKTVEVAVFVAVVALWIAFLGAVVFSQSSIHDVWQWFKDQSLFIQIPTGFLFLPWVIGMWAWETSWATVLRLVIVFGLAWATTAMFSPWKTQ